MVKWTRCSISGLWWKEGPKFNRKNNNLQALGKNKLLMKGRIPKILFREDQDRQGISKCPHNNILIFNYPIHCNFNNKLRSIKINNFTTKREIHLIFMLKIHISPIYLANNKFKKMNNEIFNVYNKILTNKIIMINYREFKFKKNRSQNNCPSFLKTRKIRTKWM